MTSQHQKELEILEFWEKNQIYEKVKEKNKSGKPFNFVEGPPYPTGEAHLGHLRNWAIKDFMFRLKRYLGHNTYVRDGYDVHGLPVETKVQNKLGLKTVDDIKKFGEENFVLECKKYVAEIINDMKGVRRRYALWMDSDHYQTSHPEYVSLAWQFFKKAEEKGLLYKDFKSVAWSPGAETTLSDYEIKDTYAMLDDPSIYVKFPLKKEYTTTGHEESLVIWTTTPWTMQSNLAIAMHPEFDYAKALVEIDGKEEVLILAEQLVTKVIKTLSKSQNITLKNILEVKKGIEFEGVKYNHILLEETPAQQEFAQLDRKFVHAVVMADYVTLGEGESVLEKLEKKATKHSISGEEVKKEEQPVAKKPKSEGTGLVHTAPGHGFDDYDTGKKYNLPIYSPLDSKAIITEGKFKEMYFKDADKHIIEYLKEKKVVLHAETKTHKYPLCWRTKVPIVYRAVEQWWIKRSAIIDEIIKEDDNVTWHPEFAKTSFRNLMSNAGDWPISRQRFWGIPLPIFEDEEGNYEVFGSKEELEARIGKQLDDIHRDDLKELSYTHPEKGTNMQAVPFIADVWFDSGCASFASHYGEGLSFDQIIEKYYPITWITESEDQIRGWFSSLFNVGYVVTGKAPYRDVLYYKFVMAKDGQKMSKSLGNGITGNESIENWGADITRYYLLTKRPPEDQINFDPDEIPTVQGVFTTIRNVFKLVSDYMEQNPIRHPTLNLNALSVEDQWILYRLNRTLFTFRKEAENFHISVGLKELEEFVVRDFSKVYLKLIKDRLEERDENLLVVLNHILKDILIVLSMASPFIAEELYQKTTLHGKKESIFLENFPEIDELVIKEVEKKQIHTNFDLAQEIIQATLNAREKAKIGVRWPLSRIDLGTSESLKSQLELFEPLIKTLTNIHSINYSLEGVDVEYIIKPDFANLKKDFKDVSEAIKIINLNKKHIVDDIKAGSSGETYEGVKVDFNKHLIKEVQLKGNLVSSEFNLGTLVLETAQDEILLEEGYLRELTRKVQQMRKEAGLNKADSISVSFEGSDQYFLDIVDSAENLIKKKVGAQGVLAKAVGDTQSFDIKDKKLVISIRKEN